MATTDRKLWFGGRPLPCTVERFPEIKKPARKFRQYNIPGRNGDIFFQDDAYENVIQKYDIYAGSDKSGSQQPWSELAASLYLNGYQVLQDSYDPQHFRYAVFNGPIDVDNSWNTHGRASIEFNCRPERYRTDGKYELSFEHQNMSIHLWAVSDLSAHIRGSLTGFDDAWAISIISGSLNRTVTLNWHNDGTIKKIVKISPGTETTAISSSVVSTRYNSITIGIAAVDLIIPADYFDEEPVIAVDGEVIGAAAILNNPYMPSNPDIILHKIAAHTGEERVFQINNKTIYIDYDSTTPYYFINTEKQTVMSSATLTGERAPANNVYMSAGIKLNSGENAIFTTEWYDAVIIPNWWEL